MSKAVVFRALLILFRYSCILGAEEIIFFWKYNKPDLDDRDQLGKPDVALNAKNTEVFL